MRRFLIFSLQKVAHVISKLNSRIFPLLEVVIQESQGKGSGGFSVEDEAKVAIKFLSPTDIKNPIVLDVGANIGNYTEAILKFAPQSKVFAFEPSSKARNKLEERFAENDSVRVVPFALGKTNSFGTLWADFLGSGMASLTKRKMVHFGIDFNESESVEVITLDSWSKSNNIFPDIIKLDVEGHELDVLEGGMETLASAQIVQFEFGGCNIDTRTFFQDFWYLFTEYGFTIYRVSTAGPIRISFYSESDECFRTTNYLAVRENLN